MGEFEAILIRVILVLCLRGKGRNGKYEMLLLCRKNKGPAKQGC